jgi:hypothetical protein
MAGRVRCQRAIEAALPAPETVWIAKSVDPDWQLPDGAEPGRVSLSCSSCGLNGHIPCVGVCQ